MGFSGQTLCVTHLPQVAAQGHHQLRVSKLTDGKTTRTTLSELTMDERVEEVARMLGRAYGQLRRASEEFQNTIRQDLAALEREEDVNRNKAVAQELRERFAAVEDVQTAIIRERDGHG